MRRPRFGLNRWKNPDHTVRLDYAQRSGNQRRLLQMATSDVNERVRMAAAKNLRTDASRLVALEHASNDRISQFLVDGLESDGAREAVARMGYLPVNLRLSALEEILEFSDGFLSELAKETDPPIAVFAIERCDDLDALTNLYSEDLPDAVAIAIVHRVKSEAFSVKVYESTPSSERRLAAIRHIYKAELFRELYPRESDSAVREIMIKNCDDEDLLQSFFEDEDDEELRVRLAGRLSDEAFLRKLATTDYNLDVRYAATTRIQEETSLVEVILGNEDSRILEAVLSHDLSAGSLEVIASRSQSSRARMEAVLLIEDNEILKRLAKDVEFPDTRWFAGRRVNLFPINNLHKITDTTILLKAAEVDDYRLARVAAARKIKESWGMNRLAQSPDPELSALANSLLKEETIPSGVSFLPVPDRPYQLSIFPVTGEQFSEWKRAKGDHEAATRYASMNDLPVTDVLPDEIARYCAWLGSEDHASYRLPYFDEWRHAAITDSRDWFSESNIRQYASALQASLVFFGEDQCPRPLHQAVSNPWGLYDMIGNVLEWSLDQPCSERQLTLMVSMDALAGGDPKETTPPRVTDFAFASGNHWADRRIRAGKWKRLVRLSNIDGIARNKVGFRLLRMDNSVFTPDVEYELMLKSQLAIGYNLEQVCWEVGQALLLDQVEVQRKYSVTPLKIGTSQDYLKIIQLKQIWESCGAITEINTINIPDRPGR